MQTVAVISPEIAKLGLDKVNLIVRTLITFDEYYKTQEPMVTDLELEWPSDYGWLHFLIINAPNTPRMIRVSFKHEDVFAY